MDSAPKRFALRHSEVSSLFTIPIALGDPAQPSEFLLDLSGQSTFALSWNSRTYLTRPHKFYKIHDSVSGRYINMSQLNKD